MREIDLDQASAIELDNDGVDNAIESASSAAVAGLDHQEQLMHGIRAYLQTEKEKRDERNG